MKKYKHFWYIPVFLFFLASCGNETIDMYTHINDDGSIYREFIHSVDSSFITGDTSKNPFPILIDKNWTVTYSYGPDSLPPNYVSGWPLKTFTSKLDSVHHLYAKVSHTYTSDEDIANKFSFNNIKWKSKVDQNFKLEKEFKWFYTVFEYNEVFRKINPNPDIKISEFLTEEEISQYFGENTAYTKGLNGAEILSYLKELDHKFEQWQAKCIFYSYYDALEDNFQLFSKTEIDKAYFKSCKDSIYKIYKKTDFDKMSDSMFISGFDDFFKTKIFGEVYRKTDTINGILKQAGENAILCYPGAINYSLTLPGKVIKTNAVIMKGDTLYWKVNSDRFLFNDYTIQAISRKPNYWAFVVTGIIVVLGLIGIWIRKR